LTADVLTIRVATDTDVDGIMALVHDCIVRMREQGIEQWDEIYPDRATILADIEAAALHVASMGDDPLAAVFTVDEHQDPRWAVAAWTITDTPIAVVHRLMVRPAHQGKGLARRLMEIAEGLARARGYAAVRLDCFSENPQALRLYQTLGYHDAGPAQLRKGTFRCLEKRLS
jgi:GNAT superfamily N-acetyltransferase